MAKSVDIPTKDGREGDIATEKYKGVGRGVAAAGGAFIAHWVAAFFGLIAGGLAGLALPKQVSAIEESFEAFAKGGTEKTGLLSKFVRGVAGLIQGGSEHMSNLVTRWSFFEPTVKRLNINPKRVDAIIFGGGITALTAFLGSSLLYGGKSFAQAGEGRAQFDRAQREILEMREQYDTLRDKYMQTRMELEDLRTVRQADAGRLTISRDDPPVRQRDSLVASSEKPGALVSAITRESALASAPSKNVASS